MRVHGLIHEGAEDGIAVGVEEQAGAEDEETRGVEVGAAGVEEEHAGREAEEAAGVEVGANGEGVVSVVLSRSGGVAEAEVGEVVGRARPRGEGSGGASTSRSDQGEGTSVEMDSASLLMSTMEPSRVVS